MSYFLKVNTNGRKHIDSLTTVGHSFLQQALMLGRFVSFSFGKGEYLVLQQEPLPTKSIFTSKKIVCVLSRPGCREGLIAM
jgi:hypothetical protein